MERDTNTYKKLFPILSMVLRQPESILTWFLAFLLSIMTAASTEITDLDWLFFNFKSWHWLLYGALLQLALLVSAIRNPKSLLKIHSRSLNTELDSKKIRNPLSREQFMEAMNYHDNMQEFVASLNISGAMRSSLNSTLTDISNWVRYMHDLALKIDSFEANDLIKQDLIRLPGQIREVENQLAEEEDETLRNDLEARRERLQLQHENLKETERVARRAKISLQNTRVSLATIYAQMARLGTLKSIDGSRANRLREEIREEVNALNDVLLTLDEVRSADVSIATSQRINS